MTISLSQVQNIATVLTELNQALFEISQFTGVLAPIVRSNAIQFISFKPSKYNNNHIIDLISLPPGLEVATGNIYQTCSDYYNMARSLVLPVDRDCDDCDDPASPVVTPTIETGCTSVESMQYRQKTSCLITVAEKLKRIKY